MAQKGRPRKTPTINAHSTEEAYTDTIPKVEAERMHPNSRIDYMNKGTGSSAQEIYEQITNKLTTMRNNQIEKGVGAEDHKDKAEMLRYEILTKTAEILATESKPKCDLNNIEEVKSKAAVYLTSCADTNTYPSMMGLAVHGFGMSRQNLLAYLKNHPDTPTANFINEMSDMFADILTNASLQNRANVVQTIFQLKNHFGHTDKQEVTIVAPTNSEQKPEELVSEVDALPE